MPKALTTIDKASCRSHWDSKNKWFKFSFFEGYFPKEDAKPFLTLCIPSETAERTSALDTSLKARIKREGFAIKHYSIVYNSNLNT